MSSLIYLLITIITVYSIVSILLLFLSYFVFGHLIHIFKITPLKEVKTSIYDFLLFFLPLCSWMILCLIFQSKTKKTLESAAIESMIVSLEIPIFWFIKLFIEPNHQIIARILMFIISISVALCLLFLFPLFLK